MLEENKTDVSILHKISLFISVLAIILSIVNFVFFRCKCGKKNENNEVAILNQDFKPIEKVPDVEIVKADGTVSTIKSSESNDKISDIIDDKKKNQKNKEQKKINKIVKVREVEKNIIPVKREQKNIKKNNDIKKKYNYVIQVGSFKSNSTAKSQCNKVVKQLNGQKCFVLEKNGIFRSTIFGFNEIGEANRIANKISNNTGINVLVKKL